MYTSLHQEQVDTNLSQMSRLFRCVTGRPYSVTATTAARPTVRPLNDGGSTARSSGTEAAPPARNDITKVLAEVGVEEDVDREGEGDARVPDQFQDQLSVAPRATPGHSVIEDDHVNVGCRHRDAGEESGGGHPQSHQGRLDSGPFLAPADAGLELLATAEKAGHHTDEGEAF